MKLNELWAEKRLENKERVANSPSPKVRSPNWDFSDFDWYPADKNATENNLFRSTYLHALSLLFPDGERFFIRSVKRYADQITDDKLKKDVKAFIAQEAQHGRQHEFLNEKIFGAKYEVKSFLENWTNFAFGFLEKLACDYLPFGGGRLELAVTAAAEHYTATWGAGALRSESMSKFNSQQIKDLIRWHAIEEIEHKHVAFDVLRSVEDNYFLRAYAMVITTALIGGLSVWSFAHLLKQEKDIDWGKFLQQAMFEFTNKDGLFLQFAIAFLTYFKPGFHPSDDDDYELARKFAEDIESRIMKAA